MLDYDLSATVSDQVWGGLALQAVLPCGEEEYFAASGAAPCLPDSRRRYRRVRVRGRAAVQRRAEELGVYTIDVSPIGIGFFSPLQLFPKERVTMTFEEYGTLELLVSRCRRTQQKCYSCGAHFVQGVMNPATYRQFLHRLKV